MQIGNRNKRAGFTLMELVVVLFIVGLLAALALPNVSASLQRAREAALRENLSVMRRAIDDYHGDRGTYPDSLSALVENQYIRFIPEDPIAGDGVGWETISDQTAGTGVRDVRSRSGDTGTNGVAYSQW